MKAFVKTKKHVHIYCIKYNMQSERIWIESGKQDEDEKGGKVRTQ